MKKIYYLFVIDIIKSNRKNNVYGEKWKFITLFLISFIHSVNIFTIYTIINILGGNIFLLKINILKGTVVNSAIAFFIQFFLGIFILDYFLIFHKDRYLKHIDKYKDRNGKFAIKYTNYSLILAFICALVFSYLKYNLKVI